MKNILILALFFVSVNIFSQEVFGQWTGDFYYHDSEKDVNGYVEVEFMEDVVIFHYQNGESVEFEYYFDEFDDLNLLFIDETGYYYEFVNDNIFRLVPAFGSEIAEIIFHRG